MALLEKMWQARRMSYPKGAHVPDDDTTAEDFLMKTAEQSRQSQRRRSTMAEFHKDILERRRSRPVRERRISSITGRPLPSKYDDDDYVHGRRQSIVSSGNESILWGYQQRERKASVTPSIGPRVRIQSVGGMSRSESLDDTFSGRGSRSATHIPLKEVMSSPSGVPYARTGRLPVLSGQSENYPVPIHSEFHRVIFDFTESKVFSGFILSIILLNTIILIVQTWSTANVYCAWIFAAIDYIFLGIYIMEIVLKLYSWRMHFFSEGWNWLDFIIVTFNSGDFLFLLIMQNNAFGGATIFRLLRILRGIRTLRALRVLRTIRFLANLQVIMATILQSIRSIGAIILLILLFIYIFAVMGRELYAAAAPEYFASIFLAFITLFQLLTLDDWFDIYTTVYQNDHSFTGKFVFVYLTSYIIVEYFIFLNLFVAVLVDNFHLTIEAQNTATKKNRSGDDSDDEDNVYGFQPSADTSSESDMTDEITVRKGLEDYYPNMNNKDRNNLKFMLQLSASLEYNMHMLNTQTRVCNTMIDLCTDGTDDF